MCWQDFGHSKIELNWMYVRKKNFHVSCTWYKSLVKKLSFLGGGAKRKASQSPKKAPAAAPSKTAGKGTGSDDSSSSDSKGDSSSDSDNNGRSKKLQEKPASERPTLTGMCIDCTNNENNVFYSLLHLHFSLWL